ncbi:MAG: enoyl-CoA hydratase/isomerase family protein [Vicinamibacterales bacterium]
MRGGLLSLEMVRSSTRRWTACGRTPGCGGSPWKGADAEFSFGARIQEHAPDQMIRVLPATHAVMRRLLALPVPTAAIVEGRCLGGGFELALCCDDILAAPKATFGLPEITVGAFPPLGALLLPLRAGASRAARAVVTGDTQTAEYWHQAGLVSVAAGGRPVLESAGDWFDQRLAGHSAVALSHAARASRLVLRTQVEPLIEVVERQYLDELLRTHDAAEGVRAFVERRPPAWDDR